MNVLKFSNKSYDDNNKLNNTVIFYNMTEDNINNPKSVAGKLCIGSGIINLIAYITFSISWVFIQFNSDDCGSVRTKYGNNAWSNWKK